MQLFTVFILSLFLTLALVPVFRRLAFRMNIVDVPDERKVHVLPMPKTGGISMAVGAFIPFFLWVPKDDFVSAVFIGSMIIVFSGLADDIRPLASWQKLLPQVAAALLVIFWGGVRIRYIGLYGVEETALPEAVSIVLTLFVIIGVTNAINLSDGLDGLAGGISMLSFVMMAFLAFQCETMSVALVSIAMVGAIAGFLRFNTHPAVLFMGDAGSQLLGFLAVVFALVLTQGHTPYSRVLSLTLIGFPILDTLMVMVERMAKGRSPFKADKNHFHHRLLRLGFSHAEAVLIIYLIQACFLSLAFIFRFYEGWVHVLIFGFFSVTILSLFFYAHQTGWRVTPDPGALSVRKKWVKAVKDRKIFIRTCFGAARYGLPVLLAAQCAIPEAIPGAMAAAALVPAGLLGFLPLIPQRFQKAVLRSVICLMIPLILYLTEMYPGPWFTRNLYHLNIMAHVGLVISVLLTMRLTRRQKGFKLTTMDILVFIVILVFPNLPTTHVEVFGAGAALARALVLFFSFDVLLGEFREETGFMTRSCVVVLSVFILRGFFG
ncbi:MAG: MraY family glycosyltransferase [Desulfobacteraceae bacterium]|nr:MraY family glycosyltransferase [Desulfobacteraceae bacterium]